MSRFFGQTVSAIGALVLGIVIGSSASGTKPALYNCGPCDSPPPPASAEESDLCGPRAVAARLTGSLARCEFREQRKGPESEDLESDAINEAFDHGGPIPWKERPVIHTVGYTDAWRVWQQRNIDFIACIPPKMKWVDAGCSMNDYRAWVTANPRPTQ